VLAKAFGDEEPWSGSSDVDTESSDSGDEDMLDANDVVDQLDFDFDINSEDEEDLMYGANDYEEVPVPEQLPVEGGHGMDIDESEGPENNQELENDLPQAWETRWTAEEAFRKTPVVEAFPSAEAGAPVTNIQALPRYDSYKTDLRNPNNPWDPFSSRLDWELAYWAKRYGPSATSFSRLLKIDGVSSRLASVLIAVHYT
jgi:hypothetical protein